VRILFFFIDGIGLGDNDPDRNPFVRAALPTLTSLTGGHAWTNVLPRQDFARATFIPTDAVLGVPGTPQSATGQATIMTGRNVPMIVGGHYGPKPDARIGAVVRSESVIKKMVQRGRRCTLLNAYPTAYLERIARGTRLRSANQLALHAGGVQMQGPEAMYAGRAISADFTGEAWRTLLGYPDAPIITPHEAGRRMARLAREYDFSFFDHWFTDYIGHRCELDAATAELEKLDAVMAGLLSEWDDSEGLIIITSDHGNLEDCSVRGHTLNPVPTLIIGERRAELAAGLSDLTDFAGPMLRLLTQDA